MEPGVPAPQSLTCSRKQSFSGSGLDTAGHGARRPRGTPTAGHADRGARRAPEGRTGWALTYATSCALRRENSRRVESRARQEASLIPRPMAVAHKRITEVRPVRGITLPAVLSAKCRATGCVVPVHPRDNNKFLLAIKGSGYVTVTSFQPWECEFARD